MGCSIVGDTQLPEMYSPHDRRLQCIDRSDDDDYDFIEMTTHSFEESSCTVSTFALMALGLLVQSCGHPTRDGQRVCSIVPIFGHGPDMHGNMVLTRRKALTSD